MMKLRSSLLLMSLVSSSHATGGWNWVSESSSSEDAGVGFAPRTSNSNNNNGLHPSTCQQNESHLKLSLVLDDHPEETGWSLECRSTNEDTTTGQQVYRLPWYVEAGTFPKDHNYEHTWIERHACVHLDQEICTFTMRDSAGNGLGDTSTTPGSMVLKSGDPGWFELTVDGTTVARHDERWAFDEQQYCIGAKCGDTSDNHNNNNNNNNNNKPQPNQVPTKATTTTITQSTVCHNPDDIPVELSLHLDDHPEETSWIMVCSSDPNDNDKVVWNVPRGSFANAPFHHVRRSVCLPQDDTCVVLVTDANDNGIHSSEGFTLTYSGTVVGQYEYDTQGEFTTKQYCLGKYCDGSKRHERDEEEEDKPITAKTFKPPCNYFNNKTTTTAGGQGLFGLSNWEDEYDATTTGSTNGNCAIWISLAVAVALLLLAQGIILTNKSRLPTSDAAASALAATVGSKSPVDGDAMTTASTSKHSDDDDDVEEQQHV